MVPSLSAGVVLRFRNLHTNARHPGRPDALDVPLQYLDCLLPVPFEGFKENLAVAFVVLLQYFERLFLARFEETQMEALHPEYADSRGRTGMFVPGDLGGKLFRYFLG